MRQRRRRALVIGGSIAGLYVSRLLARRGWEVEVFERVKEDLRSRGAGIATHPETFAALRLAGIDTGADLGIRVERRRAFDRTGAVILDEPYPQVMTSWAKLYALLRDEQSSVHLRLGTSFTRFEDSPCGVTAVFADGSRADGDILIGADGLRSTIRHALMPTIGPSYSGFIAWRGLVPEQRLSARARQKVFDYFSVCMPPGEQMAGYPVSDIAAVGPARLAYNFIWYRPVSTSGLDRFLTDANGRRHEINVPPPLVRSEIVAEMRRDAEALLSPEFVDIVEQADEPFYQPIFDLGVPSLVKGRVALIGDAAFVVRPHVGAGVTKAFEDAITLARSLDEEGDIDAGLAAFDAVRTRIGHRIVERGRRLGAVVANRSLDERRRAWEMMMGSATLQFLQEEQSDAR